MLLRYFLHFAPVMSHRRCWRPLGCIRRQPSRQFIGRQTAVERLLRPQRSPATATAPAPAPADVVVQQLRFFPSRQQPRGTPAVHHLPEERRPGAALSPFASHCGSSSVPDKRSADGSSEIAAPLATGRSGVVAGFAARRQQRLRQGAEIVAEIRHLRLFR